jgi:transposase InsO family protein
VSDDVAARLLACRQRTPRGGPRKLLAYLARRQPRVAWPAASTVGELLKRHGLVRPRRRRPQPGHPGRPTTPMDAPNAVWTADFKGQFRTGDGATATRSPSATATRGTCSRAAGCSAWRPPARGRVRAPVPRVRLPARIRSDNGVPFATAALGRLSALSAWWIKLGITPELIEPSSPQQNGQHERMHRTLKAEATKPARASLAAQQRRFDAFRPSTTGSARTRRSATTRRRPLRAVAAPYPRGWRTPSTRGTLRCAT